MGWAGRSRTQGRVSWRPQPHSDRGRRRALPWPRQTVGHTLPEAEPGLLEAWRGQAGLSAKAQGPGLVPTSQAAAQPVWAPGHAWAARPGPLRLLQGPGWPPERAGALSRPLRRRSSDTQQGMRFPPRRRPVRVRDFIWLRHSCPAPVPQPVPQAVQKAQDATLGVGSAWSRSKASGDPGLSP